MQLTESPVKHSFDSLCKKRSDFSTKIVECQPGLTATIKVKETTLFLTTVIEIDSPPGIGSSLVTKLGNDIIGNIYCSVTSLFTDLLGFK